MPIVTAKRSCYWCDKCNRKTDFNTIYNNSTERGIPYGVCPTCGTFYFSTLGMGVYNKQVKVMLKLPLGLESICNIHLKEDN